MKLQNFKEWKYSVIYRNEDFDINIVQWQSNLTKKRIVMSSRKEKDYWEIKLESEYGRTLRKYRKHKKNVEVFIKKLMKAY